MALDVGKGIASVLVARQIDPGVTGPAVAGIYMKGPWVVGAIAQNLWSFAGDDDRSDVDAMTLRPEGMTS